MHRVTLIVLTLALAIEAFAQGAGPITNQPLSANQKALVEQAASHLRVPPQGTVVQGQSIPIAQQRKLDVLGELLAGIDSTGSGDHKARLHAQALSKAKGKLKGKDVASAGEYLTAISPFQAGSADWHFDVAQRWLALAQELSFDREGKKDIPIATEQTLQHLEQGAALGRQRGSIPAQLAAKRTAAFVHERFRGDSTAAIASYREALALQPDDQGAREGLSRLEKSLAHLQARLRSGNR